MRAFSLFLLAVSPLAATVPNNIVRPDFQNAHRPNVNSATTATIFTNGGIANGTNTAVPTSNGISLREYAFGEPALPYLTPYSSFSDDVLFNGRTLANGTVIPAVYARLYPAGFGTPGGVTQNRAQIISSNAAFRYKFLIYGEDPNATGTPAILNVFEQTTPSSGSWFTNTDRALVQQQIEALRDALAFDPLNRVLQSALLDVYYDWAVAEMQFARIQLAIIARSRLGLQSTPTFIIDEEIAAYTELVAATRKVLDLYGSLFSFAMAGIKTSDFAPASGGAPFGYFVFQKEVPLRAQTPLQYAPQNNGAVINVLPPTASNTFSGYKDYRTLLTVLGQFSQYQADLARLQGLREAGGDVTAAREGLTAVQEAASTVALLDHMFAAIDFASPQFSATGVNAAKTVARIALNDALGVRAFINGTSNVLGLDPNFLLLLPPEPANNAFDTYDLLKNKLTAVSGSLPVGPLAVALANLGDPTNPTTGGGAVQAYTTFRESVDQVSSQLAGVEIDFAARFVQITGYPFGGNPGWNGINPHPTAPSELGTIERSIASLRQRTQDLGALTLQLLAEVHLAEETVTVAEGIDDTITEAQSTYLTETAAAWEEIHLWAGLAAASDAAAEAVYALAGVDFVSAAFSGGAPIYGTAIAGAANTAIQSRAAVLGSQHQQRVEEASLAFETKLALANVPLAVQQAKVALARLLREAFANRLEIQSNFTALAQAVADKAALLGEVSRLERNLAAARSSLSEKYFADPIHYLRAERAILAADATFRTAQRWVFFTCRALEYKWQERFSIFDSALGELVDIETIYKARNASELANIVQKMAQWDLNRTGFPQSNITVISLRDQFVTPNPDDINLDFLPTLVDRGLRYHPTTRAVVDKLTRFRQLLMAMLDGSGNLIIPFDTTVLENFGSNFFAGPDFSDLQNPESGFYRNKIDWIAVNIIATDGVTPPNINGRSGRVTYAGNTFFRTRVPIRPDRTTATTTNSSEAFNPNGDFSGEFIVAPFRLFQDTNFTGVFDLFDVQNVGSMKFAYSADSANNQTVLTRLTDPSFGFLRNDLKERSVAATRWNLRVNAGQVVINNIQDIEIVIRHIAYPRPQIH